MAEVGKNRPYQVLTPEGDSILKKSLAGKKQV
jgi:hypothetical protein